MVCIYCGHRTRTINSRLKRRSNQTWRRKECLECLALFTTIESPLLSQSLQVKDPNNTLSGFVPEKLFLSLYESLRHRQTALSDAIGLSQTVTNKVSVSAKDGVIDSRSIADAAIVALNRFDKAASTHYKAFHVS